ncbi:hypothetical protein K438DRAFT_1747360 [Mycena galopus ATCC 62051]|nr:hypothetical protein K438DRAFT_1747360 [Mycena galopus ATCC 62051]
MGADSAWIPGGGGKWSGRCKSQRCMSMKLRIYPKSKTAETFSLGRDGGGGEGGGGGGNSDGNSIAQKFRPFEGRNRCDSKDTAILESTKANDGSEWGGARGSKRPPTRHYSGKKLMIQINQRSVRKRAVSGASPHTTRGGAESVMVVIALAAVAGPSKTT